MKIEVEGIINRHKTTIFSARASYVNKR